MNDQEFEDYINKLAAGLPRRRFSSANKQAVWMRIQNYIREERLHAERFKKSHAGFWAAWRLSRAVAAFLIVVLSVGIVGGVANAAKGSLPGESLYPVKKAVEQVEVAIASAQGPEQKVQTLKIHAQTRLHEVTSLVDEKNVADPVVQESLKDLQDATDKVVAASESSPELKSHAVELAREEQEVLAQVETKVDGEIKETVQKALSASRESLGKLESADAPAEEVKGAVIASPIVNVDATASSTAKNIKKPATASKPKDGILGSPILIDGITRSPADDDHDLDEVPSIVDGPAIKF